MFAGEYGQDRSLLGPAYHVFSCKAALFNLLQESGTMGVYARFVSRLLELPLASAAMATVPAAAEAARERWRLGSNFLGTLRWAPSAGLQRSADTAAGLGGSGSSPSTPHTA